MTENYAKPLPQPDVDSRPFWEGVREGRLMLMRCPHCARLRWPAKDFCNRCHRPGGEWVQVSGRGHLLTWTVQHHLLNAAFAPEIPYAVVLVGLEEDSDCRLAGNLRGATPDQLALDQLMEAVFEVATDEITLVHWRPVA